MSSRRTPLNAMHRALDAKLVDFGGWEMPLHYGSQIAEHHHVRRDAGMFDVSHMLAIDVEGAGAREFLLRLLANDVGRLVPGKALYSCMLNPHGGVIDDLIVYLRGEGRYRVVVNAATAEGDLAWMRQMASQKPGTAELRPRRDLAMIAVQGPEARDRTWRALPQTRAASTGLAPFTAAEGDGFFVARTGYTGEDGFELMVPAERAEAAWNALREAGVSPAGLGARDTLRLEAGMNLYGEDMDAAVTPLECGLAWTVDLDGERDFMGRRALREKPPKMRAIGLLLGERGVLRSHQVVETPHGPGLVTSGTFSPTLQASIALARVPLSAGFGEPVRVNVRDRWLRATTVKYPFVRRGRSLVEGFPAVAASADPQE
jgi:aminomethyltransferase